MAGLLEELPEGSTAQERMEGAQNHFLPLVLYPIYKKDAIESPIFD
jgi:hypothetical protein